MPRILIVQRWYSLCPLRVSANDNFSIVTGGDDFDADNTKESLSWMTAVEILEGTNAAAASTTKTTIISDTNNATSSRIYHQRTTITAEEKKAGPFYNLH